MKKILFFAVFFSQFIFGQNNKFFVINDFLITFPKPVELKNLNKESGQYLFKDGKNGIIQVSVKNASKMEFYKPDLNKTQILEAYYKWEFDYWKSNSVEADIKEISKNLAEDYILWEVTLKERNTIFLFGAIEDKIVSLSINNNLSKDQKVDFLINLYKKISKYKI